MTNVKRLIKTVLSCRFNCLIHVTVSPNLDVAEMQVKMYTVLKDPYHPPDGLQQLLVDGKSIHTTAVGKQRFLPPISACLHFAKIEQY